MLLAVVIVNFRTPDLTARCLASLIAEHDRVPSMRVVIVDGGSGDGSAEALVDTVSADQFRGWCEVIALPINGGFGFANNAAFARLLEWPDPPEFIMLLNPDTIVEPGAVALLADYLRHHPRVGAVGSQLLELDGTPTGSAFPFPSLCGELARGACTGLVDRVLRVPLPAYPPTSQAFEADWVTGASVMLRTEALRQAGMFDDGFFLYHEETELMWRMRQAGWSIYHEPRSRVRHVGGAATGVHSRPVPGTSLPRRPAYWYQSRRRFFVLTRGRIAALAAAVLWSLGHACWRVRRLVGLSRRQPVDSEIADQLRLCIPWRREVSSPSIKWGGPRGDSPAWMKRR